VSGLSESIQARLRSLADAFVAELPRRIAEIDAAAARLGRASASVEDARTLRHYSHKLAGSAATFGFQRVTACAKRMEHLLDQAIADGRAPSSAEYGEISSFVEDLRGAALPREVEMDTEDAAGELEELDAAAEPAPTTGADADEGRRVVFLLLRDEQAAATLAERFDFYGFEAIVADSPERIAESLCPSCHTAIVMDVAFVEADPGVSDAILSHVNASEGRAHVLFTSDRDDFSVRLLAVRTAGAAFFSSPLDLARIVDTVDGLTSGGGEPYHVLIVDDDAEQVSYHALMLQRAGMITSVVSDPLNMFAVLIEAKPDLILMDMYMPGCSGPELASMIRQQEAFVGVPIVFLSVETNQDKQFQAVSCGADGFLVKPIRPEHLVIAVSNRIERTRNMRFFMERDSLTGLLNHSHLMQSLATEVQRAERMGRPLCFAMIDLDEFKQVNDRHGHLTGDRVLKSLARLLVERLRKTDVIGRYGGEEFGIVMFNVDAPTATRILDGIRHDFGQVVHEAGGRSFRVTLSCGIASSPAFDGPGPISETADRALYLAKEGGRDQVVAI